MTAEIVAAATLLALFLGGLLGMRLRTRLPETHLSSETKDVVRISMGLIATMSALVVGLLLSSARVSWDAKSTQFKDLSAGVLQLDRELELYGPSTAAIRAKLRETVENSYRAIWLNPGDAAAKIGNRAAGVPFRMIFQLLTALEPANDAQRWLKTKALDDLESLSRGHFLLLEQVEGSVPMPFLVVLIVWLALLFASFGLFAPTNAVSVVALLLCAASVAGAMFLILEMDTPFHGVMRISPDPLLRAMMLLQP